MNDTKTRPTNAIGMTDRPSTAIRAVRERGDVAIKTQERMGTGSKTNLTTINAMLASQKRARFRRPVNENTRPWDGCAAGRRSRARRSSRSSRRPRSIADHLLHLVVGGTVTWRERSAPAPIPAAEIHSGAIGSTLSRFPHTQGSPRADPAAAAAGQRSCRRPGDGSAAWLSDNWRQDINFLARTIKRRCPTAPHLTASGNAYPGCEEGLE
jgi:hypothetical protein